MKHLIVTTALILALAPAAAFAADSTAQKTDDGFGGGTYFTAQTPSGFDDSKSGTDFSAEEASKIEPAAGGDVFTLPDEPPAVANQGQSSGDTLIAPSKPIVPGMAVTPQPAQ